MQVGTQRTVRKKVARLTYFLVPVFLLYRTSFLHWLEHTSVPCTFVPEFIWVCIKNEFLVIGGGGLVVCALLVDFLHVCQGYNGLMIGLSTALASVSVSVFTAPSRQSSFDNKIRLRVCDYCELTFWSWTGYVNAEVQTSSSHRSHLLLSHPGFYRAMLAQSAVMRQ